MDKAKLKVMGRRLIIAGVVLIPLDIVLIVAFFQWSRDFVGTFSLTMSLAALSVCLIGFGAAAVASSRPD